MENKIFELKDISVGYEDGIVLENVNLTLFKNDYLGIIGANGSGKTTLLKIILGIIKPLKGEIISYLEKIRFGYVPQFNLIDKKFPITVLDVVLSGLLNRHNFFKFVNKEEKNKALKILEFLKIDNIKHKQIGELSGGQLQKVFVARAIVSKIDVLVLDEPNTFLDKDTKDNLFEIIKELNKEIAIILVSHDLGIIPYHVKNIACINRTVYYHSSNKISQEIIDNYNCPIEVIAHGKISHRVLGEHDNLGK
jgi:zinc transport system ATP-binding protein